MVSKLEILARYYQIHLETLEGSFFEYQGRHYFIVEQALDTMVAKYYPMYLVDLKVQGFILVANCFGNYYSEGFSVYIYYDESYDIQQMIVQSFKVIEGQTTAIKDIKCSWCNIIDNARRAVASHAARINHNEYYVILSYYYQGMAENAINILNEIVKVEANASLPVGLEHMQIQNSYQYLLNPHNLLISTRMRDIALFYKHQLIDIKTVEYYIYSGTFSTIELMYLYARVIFPSEFFSLILNTSCNELQLKEQLITIYNGLEIEKNNILLLYYCLKKYVYIPKIQWMEGM